MKKEADTKGKSKKTIVSTVIVVTIIVLSMIFIVSASISIKKGKLIKVFGTSISYVVTPSMEPEIKVGDFIVVKSFSYSRLKENDIIVYYSSKYEINIVHRIIGMDEDGLIVKGDNNPEEDTERVTRDNYVGKVTNYGSFLGIGKTLINYRNIGYISIVLIISFMIFLEAYNLVQNIIKKKKGIIEEEISVDSEPIVIDREKMKQELLEEIKRELREKENKKE